MPFGAQPWVRGLAWRPERLTQETLEEEGPAEESETGASPRQERKDGPGKPREGGETGGGAVGRWHATGRATKTGI